MKSFYTRFVGGASGELALVGDFDPDAMRTLVTELFGAWTSPAPFTRVPNPYRAPKPTELTALTIGMVAWPPQVIMLTLRASRLNARLTGGHR